MHTALHAGGHGWQGEDGVETLDALNEAAAAAAVRYPSIPLTRLYQIEFG